ncbi:hypothetical protein [Calidifontibacter terrae]
MGKLSFLVGFAAGYVAGAKAGETRYEQIKLQANKAWQHPAVQSKVDQATTQLKERGPEVAAAAGQAALKGAGSAAKGAVNAGYQAAVHGKQGPVVPGEVAAPDADTDSGSTRLVTDSPADHPRSTDAGFDAN